MINCKVGLIAKPRDSREDCFLNLGEIFDKTIRKNVVTLYKLHENLKYMCPFKATITDTEVDLDNIEELSCVQQRYKLTRKIVKNGTASGNIKFLAPRLFDVSCMTPLFPDQICPPYFRQSTEPPIRMFILFPYDDPIIRGEIIDNCMDTAVNKKTCFYVLGNISGKNKRPTCDLSRRYLLGCGIPDYDIYRNTYDEFPDCIMETLSIIKSIMPNTEMSIYLAVAREDMNQVLGHIRLSNQLGMLDQKIRFICN